MKLKLKRPRLPACPDLSKERGGFYKLNKLIRKARQEYRTKLWDRTVGMKGKSLLDFLWRAARQLSRNGLYADSMQIREIMWSLIRYYFSFEMPGISGAGNWHFWLATKKLSIEKIYVYLKKYHHWKTKGPRKRLRYG